MTSKLIQRYFKNELNFFTKAIPKRFQNDPKTLERLSIDNGRFAFFIRTIIGSAGIEKMPFSKKAGVSSTTIRKILNRKGRRSITVRTYVSLLKACSELLDDLTNDKFVPQLKKEDRL